MPSLSPNLRSYDAGAGQVGMYATPTGTLFGTSNSALTANTAYFARFRPTRNLTVAKFAFSVGTASGTDDPLDVGIYSSDLQTKVASSGATSGLLNNGTGRKEVTLAVSLVAGTVYYAAFAANSTATLMCAAVSSANAVQLFGTSAGTAEFLSKATSYTLPASISSPAVASFVPLLALMES